ncbi:alpha/beta fold hydrolase [Microbacterium sp. SLBN-146]|uniref:alpha/beta fold hydrolase n=1 Tax=Microbacterium sp. SLBN-146 TaxID=2768457 RepID=UPI001153E8F4|nr:alpha/beta hydrolase [Microbacterium sp. SLBN-146]TQJ31707.1 TAP-like protein [Microbacterium sp. SLBN-146]
MTDIEIFEPEGRAIPYAVEGEGPAVVLIAGQGLTIGYLGTLAHSVSEEDFRVVRIGSRRPSDGAVAVTMHDLARDVVDVMDHLSVDHAWVGGHGFGGAVARIVALDHHDRVNGVLLLGVATDATDAVDLADVAAPFHDAGVVALQRAAWEAPGELAPTVPVLVIQGADDRITPPDNGEALRSSAPGLVSVVTIDGAGHLFPATHMGATSWAIEDYLDWD